jgi:integrase
MSVFKRYKGKKITAKDKNWSKGTYYVWRRIGGRIIHKALIGAQTKEQAERAAAKLIEKAFNQRYGIQDSTTTLREFASGKYDAYIEQHNVNKLSKRQYVRLLCEHFKSRLLVEITPQDCRGCQTAMQKKGYAASTVNLIMSTLQIMFRLAGEEGIIDKNPMQFVKRLKEPPPRSRLLTKDEWERLWKELEKDVLLERLITLAINLPLRRGQLLVITEDAIDFAGGLLRVTTSKGRASRIVPLNTIAMSTLRLMSNEGHLPFPLDPRKRWRRALINAGINKKGGTREENYHFHDLRKEQATSLLRNGVNPEIIRQLFGHSAMKITQKYMMPEMDSMRAAVNTLDDVQDGGEQCQ